MNPLPFDCPEGYTCTLDIYPTWHDFVMVGFFAGLIVVLLVLVIALWWTAR